MEKAEKEWWKKLLRGDGKPPHYVKVDWDKWVDEDEDTGGGINSSMLCFLILDKFKLVNSDVLTVSEYRYG